MASTQVVDAAELLSLLESSDLSVVKQIQELITDNLRNSELHHDDYLNLLLHNSSS